MGASSPTRSERHATFFSWPCSMLRHAESL
jgi:hypothetical protein